MSFRDAFKNVSSAGLIKIIISNYRTELQIVSHNSNDNQYFGYNERDLNATFHANSTQVNMMVVTIVSACVALNDICIHYSSKQVLTIKFSKMHEYRNTLYLASPYVKQLTIALTCLKYTSKCCDKQT